MSNESFWKTIGKVMCPEDKQPPSVWTLLIIVIILFGVVIWILGLPWQADIGITIFLILLAIGGQQASRQMRKKGYEISTDPARVTADRWTWFWGVLLLIIVKLVAVMPWALSIRDSSWPVWPFFLISGTLTLLAFLYLAIRWSRLIKKRQ
ncbi:MAG: hypothetical protein WC333_09745 [Dehalococcoidia bacterium]|jgi:NADH:ubiquinone oxidoreductase subunit 3 (subunit A)